MVHPLPVPVPLPCLAAPAVSLHPSTAPHCRPSLVIPHARRTPSPHRSAPALGTPCAFLPFLALVDLLGEGLQYLGAALHFRNRSRLSGRGEGVARLHLREILAQPLQIALLVLKLGEGELALAPLPCDLFTEALGLVHYLFVFLVACRVEARDDFGVPG